jgi:hypothetical protein
MWDLVIIQNIHPTYFDSNKYLQYSRIYIYIYIYVCVCVCVCVCVYIYILKESNAAEEIKSIVASSCSNFLFT